MKCDAMTEDMDQAGNRLKSGRKGLGIGIMDLKRRNWQGRSLGVCSSRNLHGVLQVLEEFHGGGWRRRNPVFFSSIQRIHAVGHCGGLWHHQPDMEFGYGPWNYHGRCKPPVGRTKMVIQGTIAGPLF